MDSSWHHTDPQTSAGGMPRGRLTIAALSKWLLAMIILALLILAPAGTLDFWQAWVYLMILGLCSLTFISYYLVVDPDLIRRRIQLHEKEREQRNVVRVSLPLFVVAF